MRKGAALCCAAIFLLMMRVAAQGPVAGQSPGVDIHALLRQMTLDEKISLVHGARDPDGLGQAGYWPGLPRLGIPPLRLADGPAGLNVSREATGMPAPVGLAATFHTEAARLYGVVMGRDARALGQDILLGPQVDIVRDPVFRRNHTTFGEDPFLNAQMGAALTTGIQSQGVMAEIKHLAGYTGAGNVLIDEQTMHEIYLPPFEAALKAGAASVMCAYNRINSAWSCHNPDIQNAILRGLWGFQGFITSDWGALHGPLAITEGVDLEMPGRTISIERGGPYFTDALKAAVEKGTIPASAVDQAVGRILYQMERFHLLDKNPPARPASVDIEADAKIIREIAGQGAVLLKNDGGVLPLGAADLASLAVIGPTGGQVAVGSSGERAYGFESRFVSPLAALRRTAPQAKITYAVGDDLTGVPIPASVLSNGGTLGPLRRQTTPETRVTQVERTMDFKGPAALQPGMAYSWTGTLTLRREGDYTFMVQSVIGDGSEGVGAVMIDGLVAGRSDLSVPGGSAGKKWSSLLPTTDGRDNPRLTVRLAAGAHPIEITASSTGKAPLQIRFAWVTPEMREVNIQAAVAAAKAARTPVVFAWSGAGDPLALPEDQDELIRKVAAVNPRTIVVLNTGTPVAMPWKENVRAILEMWYPGQEGGWATADLLLGRANPGGRLPVTFPARIEDTPAHAAGHPERLEPPPPPAAGYTGGVRAVNPEAPPVTFSEGIFVGYRWYDQQNIVPLFPFGHGLSYTRFHYSNLAVSRAGDRIDVSFTVRNTGPREGAEVPQVYVGLASKPPVPIAPMSLVGFQRIELEPGRSQLVRVHVDARGLSYWSTAKHDWVVDASNRTICVGSSSRDIRLRAKL